MAESLAPGFGPGLFAFAVCRARFWALGGPALRRRAGKERLKRRTGDQYTAAQPDCPKIPAFDRYTDCEAMDTKSPSDLVYRKGTLVFIPSRQTGRRTGKRRR